MTVLIGILCEDGIVIGADSSATSAVGTIRTIEQKTHKIDIIDGKLILAGTGQIGLGQRFKNIVDTYWSSTGFKQCEYDVTIHLCRQTLENFAFTGIPKGQIDYGALLAFPCNGNLHLCEFELNSFQPELKTEKLWYVSMGSGQLIADPFLGFIRRVFWKDSLPTLSQGILASTWALKHTIDVNPGGIKDPINIAVLKKNGNAIEAKELEDDELQEYHGQITYLENYISNYPQAIQSKTTEKIPDIE